VTFRLLSYNIRRGGTGRERPLAEVIDACRPDLVVLQEATDRDAVERIAVRCGMAQCATQPRTSLGFMSRDPCDGFAWHRPRFSRHAFLEIHPRRARMAVFGVHLSAVHAAWTERRRVLELDNLLRAVRAYGPRFHLLAGDFNTLAPGELLDVRKLPRRLRALVWLSGGRIRWRTIERVLNAGYADGYRSLHEDDPGLTFPVWAPHVRLDYVFLPATELARLTGCRVVRDGPARTASDHFPLLAEVSPPAGSPAPRGL
jgi:exodeoxyribonuclease-3